MQGSEFKFSLIMRDTANKYIMDTFLCNFVWLKSIKTRTVCNTFLLANVTSFSHIGVENLSTPKKKEEQFYTFNVFVIVVLLQSLKVFHPNKGLGYFISPSILELSGPNFHWLFTFIWESLLI